jgi:phospholipid/cholesterol/gamma-HCH transport system substrate-binding protein
MTRRNEVIVGLVVMLGLVLVVFGTVWMRGLKLGGEEQTVRARFSEVGQLLTGSNVKFRGVPIGRVEAIELEATGAGVIVTMVVDAAVSLPEDPAVILAPESLFGDWQAEIIERRRFPRNDYAEAPDAKILPGYSLPDMVRLTAVADEIAQNLAEISTRFETAFTEETADNIRRAIDNIQSASAQLTQMVSRQQQAIDELSTDLQETTQALGEAVATINRTFQQVESAIAGDKLVNIVAAAEHASVRIDSLSSELLSTSRTMQRAAMTADTLMRSVGTIANSMSRGEGTLGLMLRDTTLYWRIVETNAELQALLRDLRLNPRRYINVRIF